MAKCIYRELSKKQVRENRNVVVSEMMEDGSGKRLGYSVVEQLIVNEGEKETRIFLKGGIRVHSQIGLLQLKEAIDEACFSLGLFDETDEEQEQEENTEKEQENY